MKDKIAQLRHNLNLSLVAFSKPLGCSPTQIRRMESGTVIPSEDILEKICDRFKVDRRYFTGEMKLEDAVQIKSKEEKRKEVGKRLREIRKDKKLTIVQLGELCHTSESRLSEIETGKSQLGEITAKRIAKALKVGSEWLLTGEERNKNYPVDDDMVEWLKNHEEARKGIRALMDKEED